MKSNILKIVAILLMLAGSLYSCKKDDKDDIDMSKIDFSNIEDLYAQPLPVIQKAIQGKWKWYATFGGVVGIMYPVNTFVDITDSHYIITSHEGSQRTVYFTWKKSLVSDGYKTWVMWDKERDTGIWFFDSIKNDTLGVGYFSVPFSGCIVRVK